VPYRHPAIALAVLLSILTASLLSGRAEAREERVVAIADREMRIALAGDDCFFDRDHPQDRGVLDQLAAAAGGEFVVLLAYTGCRTLDGRRAGGPPTLARLGYVMIAETHLEPVFAFDQPALAAAISGALKDRAVKDYQADVARLARDLEAAWKTLAPGGRKELGIVHRDRYGPVLATVLAVPATAGRKAAPRVMLHQSLMVSGKVLSFVAARDYQNVETIFDAYGDLSAVIDATASRN